MRFKRTLSAIAGAAVSISSFAELPIAALAAETTVYSYAYDDYTVSYSITDSWGQSDNISVTISNTGNEMIENWMLYYEDFSADFSDVWNAAVVETEPGMFYIRNAGYNANIAPNSSVTFGCVANGEDKIPSEILMQQTRVTTNTEDYDASLHITSDWGEAFNGEIVLRNNTDRPLEWWELTFNTNYTIVNVLSSWSAESTDLGDTNYRFKGTYNGIIPPHAELAIGFTGRKNENQDTPQIEVTGLTEAVFGGYPEKIDIDAERQAEREHIESLNQDSEYGVDIQNNEDGTVSSIDGKFSEVTVVDGDSALESLIDVKYLLGLKDPHAQLVLESVFCSELADYNTFYFNELYNGVRVYGRTVTVVARKDGTVLSLASSFLDVPEMNTTPAVSAASAAAANGAADAELVIYTYGDYEEEPVLAYIMNNGENTVICSAMDGAELAVMPNVLPTPAEEDSLTPERDIFSSSMGSFSRTDANNNLVWRVGRFGNVRVEDNMKELELSDSEKARLKADNDAIDFKFAYETYSYMKQNVPGDEEARQAYLNAHPGSAPVYDLNYNDQDAAGYWYIDVKLQVYSFDQIYNDYLVYGRKIALTVNDQGDSVMLDSNILSADALSEISVPASDAAFIGSDAAIQSVLDQKGITNTDGRVVLEGNSLNNTKPVIYSWETDVQDCTVEPVFAYVVLDKVGEHTYIVDAEDGDILLETYLGKGLSEPISVSGDKAEPMHLEFFPITVQEDNYVMSSIKPNAKNPEQVYNNKVTARLNSTSIKSDTSCFYEPEAVTGYMTMLSVYDFYESEFQHSSYDNNRNGLEREITVNVKEHTWVGAAASAGYSNENYYSRGDGVETYGRNEFSATHEFDHFLFREYNYASSSGYTNACINEGYSNLFAFLNLGWVNRGWSYELPNFNMDFSSASLQYLLDAGKISSGFGHDAGRFLIYPAYLMHTHVGEEGALTDHEIAMLYHISLTMGKYSNKSTMNSVRVNVMKAAKALEFDEAKMAIIREALDYVWSRDYREFFAKVNLREYGNYSGPITNATVTLKKTRDDAPLVSVDSDAYRYKIEPGEYYYLEVSAPGYLTYRDRVHMFFRETNNVNVQLVAESYDADNNLENGIAKVKAVDLITQQPSGAIIQFRTYNENFVQVPVRDENGDIISVLADPETGYTENFEFAPGYYFPYSVNCDDHFVKSMLTVPSGNTTAVDYTFRDTNFSGDNASIFYDIHVDEFNESTVSFNAFNSISVETNELTYQGRSGESNFGRAIYLLFYKPETTADYKVVFQPSSSQLLQLESILVEEGSLRMNYSTGEYELDPNLNDPLRPHRDYFNIIVTSKPRYGAVQKTQTISGLELYQAVKEHGEYVLYTLHADSDGNLTVD